MKLEINGHILEVPQDYVTKLSEDLWSLIEQLYEEKIPDGMKTGMAIPVRAMLVAEEIKTRAELGKEAARAWRPPAKADVNLWLFRQFLPYVREQLNHATITCEATADTVTAFNISLPNQGITGGQVDITGYLGMRENNGAQVP